MQLCRASAQVKGGPNIVTALTGLHNVSVVVRRLALPRGGAFIVQQNLGAIRADVAIAGAAGGPLAATRFVAKDVFDVAGHPTGAGSPDWLRSHGAAARTAPAVQRLLDAGAELVGKSETDELAYSLMGQNAHYGTPINPRARDRLPGGSSSGSAVAVAGGLADFALGTDCGGSVRLPASYCGILGFRPSHARIPLDGIVPLAPSFDTVGWFARDPALLERVGAALLGEAPANARPQRLIVAADLFGSLAPEVATAFEPAITRLREAAGRHESRPVFQAIDADRLALFRTLQGAEAWKAHGAWIQQTKPAFGPGVRERFELASRVTQAEVREAAAGRERFAAAMGALLGDGTAICLPTAPDIAPRRDATPAELETTRRDALQLLSIAGLARLPQVSLPLASLAGCPLGISVIAARGADMALLALARRAMN
jgi:amidase